MTPDNHSEPTPTSAPSLDQLVQDAAVVPIEVETRTEYREALPSLGDIVWALPGDLEPEPEQVPTVRLPLRRQAGGGRRRQNLVRASAAALVLIAGASVAMAAWMTPPQLGETPDVPIVVETSALRVDSDALSLAVGAEALARHSPAFVAPETTGPEGLAVWRRPEPAAPAPVVAFDRNAAGTALDRAAAGAGMCRSGEDPSGVARAIVTFAPSGRVTSATVNGPPFAGTTTGGCIARNLRSATVPPFSGDHVTVAKTLVIY
jgi:hypothetical protein